MAGLDALGVAWRLHKIIARLGLQQQQLLLSAYQRSKRSSKGLPEAGNPLAARY